MTSSTALKTLLVLTLLTLAQSRFLQAGPSSSGQQQGQQGNGTSNQPAGQNQGGAPAFIPSNYSSSLQCGQCVMSNYTYCVLGSEHAVVNSTNNIPTGFCCANATAAGCPQAYNSSWNCSNSYADRAYAKYVCPFAVSNCGQNQNITLNNTGDSQNVTVQNLPQGQTCFYQVQAKCGAPLAKPNDTTNVQVEYVQYQQDQVNTSQPVNGAGLNSSSLAKQSGRPDDAAPPRNDQFTVNTGTSTQQNGQNGNSQQGGQNTSGSTSGQMGPSSSGQMGPSSSGQMGPSSSGQMGPSGSGQMGPSGSGPQNTSTSGTGSTGQTSGSATDTPFSGSYNATQGGAIVWGNPVQQSGSDPTGIKLNSTDADCTPRTMYIAVTSTTSNNATLLLQFQSVDFSSFGVQSISLAFAQIAALVGMIALF